MQPLTSNSHGSRLAIKKISKESAKKAKKIIRQVKTILKEIRESEFYSELHDQIQSEEFQRELKHALGTHLYDITMVIYTLGSLEEDYSPKYQLAVALLLQQDFFNWITRIQVFDPVFTTTDVMVLEQFGCTVLAENEKCRRQIDRPTLFYMPYAEKELIGNLLERNWCHSRINQVMLLTNKLSTTIEDYHDAVTDGIFYDGLMTYKENLEYLEAIQKCIYEIDIHRDSENFVDYFLDHLKDVTDNIFLRTQFFDVIDIKQMQYLEGIQEFMEELEINSGEPEENLLHNFAFHFFDVPPDVDMNDLLQGEEGTRFIFEQQFFKMEKLQEYQMVNLIEELINEAWLEQMQETINSSA